MSDAVRSLFFDFTSKVDSNSILKANKHVDGLKGNLNATKLAASNMTKKLVGIAAGYISIRGITAGINSLTTAANESIDSETRLSNMMKNVKGTTDAQVKAASDYASAIQSRGVAEDDAIKRGMAQLATFNLQADAIRTVTEGMTDLAVNQFGVAASGEQMQGIANVIGKAFEGNAGSLRRYGITLTKAQEEQLKAGNQMQKAAVIADVLKANVGGINKALAKTPKGAAQQFQNMFGDMKETLGMKLLPEITKFYGYLSSKLPAAQQFLSAAIDTGLKKFGELRSFMQDYVEPRFKQIGKLAGEIATKFFPDIGSAADDLQGNLGKIVTEGLDMLITSMKWIADNSTLVQAGLIGIGIAFGAFKAVQIVNGALAAFNLLLAANPITWVIVGVGALAAGLYLLVKNWDKVTGAIKKAWDWLTKWNKSDVKNKTVTTAQRVTNERANTTNRGRYNIGFAQGINRVPFNMSTTIHKDEAVIPARFNPYNPNAKTSGNNTQAKSETPIQIIINGNPDSSTITQLKYAIREVLDQRDREALHSIV
jgi:hypothetical protein